MTIGMRFNFGPLQYLKLLTLVNFTTCNCTYFPKIVFSFMLLPIIRALLKLYTLNYFLPFFEISAFLIVTVISWLKPLSKE